jgi:hypothetical protein
VAVGTVHRGDVQDVPEGDVTVTTEKTYKIVRHFENSGRDITIRRGLTLEQAQAHCQDPETSSSTCTSTAAKRRTREHGRWFDGYTAE